MARYFYIYLALGIFDSAEKLSETVQTTRNAINVDFEPMVPQFVYYPITINLKKSYFKLTPWSFKTNENSKFVDNIYTSGCSFETGL